MPLLQIMHMVWGNQRMPADRHQQPWKPKFLSLKAADIYLFDQPPVSPCSPLQACTHTHAHTYMHTCTYTHTHAHTHTHTHTQSYTFSLSLSLSLSPTHTPSLFSCHSICLIISFFLSGVTFIQPFLLLLCVFQMHSGDWSRCDAKYKVYECMFKVLKVSSWHEHACLIWYPMFRELLLDLFNFKSFP